MRALRRRASRRQVSVNRYSLRDQGRRPPKQPLIAVEEALAPIAKLEKTVADARRTRDAIAKVWESALAALRRGARSAADDGAPDLYPTLFRAPARGTARTKTTETTTTDPQTPAAASNAA